MLAAVVGTAFVGRISDRALHTTVMLFLTAIGTLLIVEGFLPDTIPVLLPSDWLGHLVGGVVFGLAIGLASSLLGVAGGEIRTPS